MHEALISFLDRISGPAGYLLLAVCAFVENVLPPIPGDTVTVFGGYLAGTGRLSLAGVVVVTTVGSFAGFMTLFGVGRAAGTRLLKGHTLPFFSSAQMHVALGWFERYGYGVVAGNRFLSGLRSVISLCAGMAGLGTRRVALYCLLSCLVWNSLLVSAGYFVGGNWENIISLLRRYNLAVSIVLGAAFVAWVCLRSGKKR